MQSTVSALTLFTVLSSLALAAPAPLNNVPLHKLELRKIPNIRDGEVGFSDPAVMVPS